MQRQAKVLGLVLNRVEPTAHSYCYYKYGAYERSVETLEPQTMDNGTPNHDGNDHDHDLINK